MSEKKEEKHIPLKASQSGFVLPVLKDRSGFSEKEDELRDAIVEILVADKEGLAVLRGPLAGAGDVLKKVAAAAHKALQEPEADPATVRGSVYAAMCSQKVGLSDKLASFLIRSLAYKGKYLFPASQRGTGSFKAKNSDDLSEFLVKQHEANAASVSTALTRLVESLAGNEAAIQKLRDAVA